MDRMTIVGRGRLGSWLASALGAPILPHTAPLAGLSPVWLTVPDGAIVAVAARLDPDALVLHSAGSLGPEVLGPRRGAVLHPLMTFPPPPGAEVPATLSGHPDAVALAETLAAKLGWTLLGAVHERARYHAAASLASGHLAALFLDATTIFAAATGSDLESARRALEPLAAATLRRVVSDGAGAITGPAARGDLATIAAHRAALSPEHHPVYDALNARIEKLRGG